ncbi:unnamed protein product [Clonostachys solani]|uniref:Uncharacterized protein n=1 Tax=Clonostachys solani TaxID=160281 RepID=A0A9P0EMN9_9HYPO|nr:unnamed protein product [Clonostachys solani]
MAEPVAIHTTATGSSGSGQRQFKKHKVLPRPPSIRANDLDASPPSRPVSEIVVDTDVPAINFDPPSPPTLKRQSKRIPTGPELPPTPPAHSRTSSSGHSAAPSSPTISGSMLQDSPDIVPAISPATPPDQRSPPTPDVTPPQPANRPKALRPAPLARGASGTTTTESRTESFTTAREELLSSEEDDTPSTVRLSGRTSQSTVRKVSVPLPGQAPDPKALDRALSRLSPSKRYKPSPKAKRPEANQDSRPRNASGSREVEAMDRSVTVKLKPAPAPQTRRRGYRRDVIEDVDDTIIPSSAIHAVRQLSLSEKNHSHSRPSSSPHSRRDQQRRATNPTTVETEAPLKKRSSSGKPPRSASSSVVDALLAEGQPQGRKTLRHVRKQPALRDLSGQYSERASSTTELNLSAQPDTQLRGRPGRGRDRIESFVSVSTVNSVGSRKARREVLKNGGIPVIVVPDRRSSTRSTSREPSLRSTSSRRSRRTQSLSSAPLDGKESSTTDRRSRHAKSYSVSDGSERTIDFPPVIPARSSSLSAPTSRTASRTCSLTTESIRAHDAFQKQLQQEQAKEQAKDQAKKLSKEQTPTASAGPSEHAKEQNTTQTASVKLEAHDAPVAEKSDSDRHQSLEVPRVSIQTSPDTYIFDDPLKLGAASSLVASPRSDRFEDGLSTKRLTARNTPFSVTSAETNFTAPEVSEALMVHMYAHQNSSVLMVNHSAKPSDGSVTTQNEVPRSGGGFEPGKSVLVDDNDEGGIPVTPPQPQFSLDDIDSPLRNPRSPPQPPSHPPALAFIPATPSGITPAPDKDIQMGNFFESIAEQPPSARRPSIVRRAFSRRRRNLSVEYPPNSSRTPNFLKRALSLSRRRNSRRGDDRITAPYRGNYPWEGDDPPEENKLHPFWRPQWSADEDGYDDEYDDDDDDERYQDRGRDEGYMRYPLVDNRPSRRRRSISARVKRTLTGLSSRDDDDYVIDDGDGPSRRTIQRTLSGNLRVMKRRSSLHSLRRRFSQTERPSTDYDYRRSFWRGSSAQKRTRSLSRRRFSLDEPIERIQGLSRRFSEKRREKRTQELRRKISGPKDVRGGVEEVIRSRKQPGFL